MYLVLLKMVSPLYVSYFLLCTNFVILKICTHVSCRSARLPRSACLSLSARRWHNNPQAKLLGLSVYPAPGLWYTWCISRAVYRYRYIPGIYSPQVSVPPRTMMSLISSIWSLSSPLLSRSFLISCAMWFVLWRAIVL